MSTLKDFLTKNRPETIALTIDPSEIETKLRQAFVQRETLTGEDVDALKYVLSHWVLSALTRRDDLHTVLLCDRLCALASKLALTCISEETFNAYRYLLEIKRQYIAIARARGYPPKQSCQVLAILDGRERPFNELLTKMDVSAGRLNQLLLVMEACHLVTIRRQLDMSLMVHPIF